MWLWNAVSVCKSVFSDQEADPLVVLSDICFKVNCALTVSEKRICWVPFCVFFLYRLPDVGQHFAVAFKHEKSMLAFCACSFYLVIVFSDQTGKAVFSTLITEILIVNCSWRSFGANWASQLIKGKIAAACQASIRSTLKTALIANVQRKPEVPDAPVGCVRWADCDVDVLGIVVFEEFCCGISLKGLFVWSSTNTWNPHCVNKQVFNPHIIDKNLKCALLGFSLIDDYDIKCHRESLMGLKCGEDTCDWLSTPC